LGDDKPKPANTWRKKGKEAMENEIKKSDGKSFQSKNNPGKLKNKPFKK
jgi:hypothetical protein